MSDKAINDILNVLKDPTLTDFDTLTSNLVNISGAKVLQIFKNESGGYKVKIEHNGSRKVIETGEWPEHCVITNHRIINWWYKC